MGEGVVVGCLRGGMVCGLSSQILWWDWVCRVFWSRCVGCTLKGCLVVVGNCKVGEVGEVFRCREGWAGVGCGVRYVEVVGYGEG